MKEIEIDEGRAVLLEVVNNYAKVKLSDANEAETRKKVIDVLLEGVLGWDPVADISYEESVRDDGKETYADYLIKTATTALVVEAKRAGRSFEIPNNKKAAKLGGFLSDGEVGSAIQQAIRYAFRLSAPFAAVTNGSTWIVFPAVRTDNIPWQNSEAHIFRSLDDIKERFVEFWELLSRQRVIEGNLEKVFFDPTSSQSQRRLLSVLRESGYRLGRNSIYEHIEGCISAAFTDESLLEDPTGLEFCYVKTAERTKYDSRLRMHLLDAKPLLERRVIRPRQGRDPEVLDHALSESIRRPPQFLLVLGQVGAGKTTFLHYTKLVSAKAAIEGKVVWLYIDFKKATSSDNPRTFIFRELLATIESDTQFNLGSWDEVVKHAYEKTINVAKNGHLRLLVAADPGRFNVEIAMEISREREAVEPYVEKILTWICRKFPVFLVIDNVDQFEEEEFQRAIFIEAQAAAKRMSLNVIMTLRDATYLRHRNSPSFDAFQVDTVYIDPPSMLPVLSKRFIYARRFLEGKSADIRTENNSRFRVDNLGLFIESVAASLLTDKNGFLLEVLSGGDVRRALALIREFLASGHTSSDRVLWDFAEERTGVEHMKDKRLAFPRHEIFKACVLGQRRFYREEDSLLLNVFDAKLGSQGKQLLRLHLIFKLVGDANAANFEGALMENLRGDLFQIGVPEGEFASLIARLLEFKVIRTADGRVLTDKSQLLPTRLGGYLVRELMLTFSYIEICSIDANIFMEEHWEVLKELTRRIDSTSGFNQIMLRCERAEKFVRYLREVEESWTVQCNRYQLAHDWSEQIVRDVIAPALEADLHRVRSSAQKKFGQYQ